MKCIDMKRWIFLLIMSFSLLTCKAEDAELNKLAGLVTSLRTGGEKAYKQAVAQLSSDAKWTPMDELIYNSEAECKASDRVKGFKLNSILSNAENAKRLQTTTASHLNGADSRFNYSLIEKTIKAGKSATYILPQRWGKQVILVIPFTFKSPGLKAKATSAGKDMEIHPFSSGVRIEGNAKKGSPLKLTISNLGSDNISYVIINYNSRK